MALDRPTGTGVGASGRLRNRDSCKAQPRVGAHGVYWSEGGGSPYPNCLAGVGAADTLTAKRHASASEWCVKVVGWACWGAAGPVLLGRFNHPGDEHSETFVLLSYFTSRCTLQRTVAFCLLLATRVSVRRLGGGIELRFNLTCLRVGRLGP